MATVPPIIGPYASRAPEDSAERRRGASAPRGREIDRRRQQHDRSAPLSAQELIQQMIHSGGPNYYPDPRHHGLPQKQNLIDEFPHGHTLDDLVIRHPAQVPIQHEGHGFPGSGGRPGSHDRPFFLVPYGNRTEAVAVPTNRGEYEQLTPHELRHYILSYHGLHR